MRKFNLTITALAGASVIALAVPAFAQDATPQQAADAADANSDIIVTAQRKAEKVTEVPISITVANQAQLERQQVNTVNDLSRVAPSLEIQQAPGQNTGGGGAIRGIGTQTFSAGAVASVGVVVDQVSQGNANISDLFDVSRIEVLKGPQGTLFGLTTSAGVINITTNAPDPSGFSARVRTELSNAGTAGSKFGNQVIQGVVNIPLASNAAIRISGVTNLRQGVNKNALTGDYNDNDRYGVRGRLLWEPTERLTVNLIGDYTKSRAENGGDFFTFVQTSGPGTALGGLLRDSVGITARLASCGVTPGEGNQKYCSGSSYVGRTENYGGSLQLDYEADPFTLTSVTAYRKSSETGFGAATNVFRGDPLELQVGNGAVNRKLSLFTQELRISSPADQFLEYTAGVFYSNQKQTRDPESLSVSVVPFPGLTIPIVRNPGADLDIQDESLAVFGQGTFHLSPSLRLIAGGRYTTDRLSMDRYDYFTPADPFSRTILDVQKFSWRLGAQYDLARDMMIYATASRGFKGGQIAIPSAPAKPFVVLPEIPMAYEAGLKTTLFGGWVADLSVFYQKIKNFQAQQCTVDSTAVISCVQTNINGVKSRGAEINFFGKVFEGLSLNTGFIYAKATYPTNFIGTDGTNIGGSQLAYAPKYKFTLSGEYEAPVTGRLNGFVAADTVWKSRVRYEANSNSLTTFRSHWLVGGRIGLRTDDNRYSVAVFGRNLFNVHEPSLMQSDFPYTTDQREQNIGAIYGPQSFRQVGISFDAKF
ncbi:MULTISPECIES: TonB-dependent receptor [Sphingobium]|jgi:iron complex outermembrane receptor protein|uniref:TonB-dependent receptor n=1 Tax=Sphingobium TaxID=165695 RepID=UPI000DBB09D2|nr:MULTISPECIES: TonB-dependent receptor [Sphingobium]KAA9011308.1 TonB-dependent receptor plug domain-containing protein [Sphingobium limneticum]MBU0931101.1 TonB-dependent receptor [Alphaproteobacteria bacterium]BBD00377.1 iron complex outermembrane recepter protein [Sphingobium sp. YG1]